METQFSLKALPRRFTRKLLSLAARPLDLFQKSEIPHLNENARMVEKAFTFLGNTGIKGDYMEFGVFEGRTFVQAWRSACRWNYDEMRFFAFDSFAGLPSKEGEFQRGQFSAPRQKFAEAIAKAGMQRVTVVEGFFNETLPKLELVSKVCFAWIDSDLYESAVPALDFLTDKLVDGAIIAFDDWFCFKGNPNAGEQRACREWLERNPQIKLMEYCDFHWAGKAFIASSSAA